jgi:hypothetical protein
VIAGKRDLVTGAMKPSGWMGYEFHPIVNLARYDTDFLNSVTDHTLGNGSLTDRQAELAVKLILKYQRQLAAKSINVEPVINPRYRHPIRTIDRSKRAWVDGNNMIVKFPYEAKIIQQLRDLLQTKQSSAHFDKEKKVWEIALSEYNVNFLVTWAKGLDFEISDDLQHLMDLILECEQQPYKIELCRIDGKLTIINAEESLLEYLSNKNLSIDDANLAQLADMAGELGYTVSDEVWEELDKTVGTDISVFMRTRNYEMTGNYGQLTRLLAYAKLVNRLPMVVFDPNPARSQETYLELLGEDNVEAIGNKRNEITFTKPVVWTHRVISDLDSIPLLVTHAGLMAGAEKTIMLQNSRKLIYFNYKLQ